MQSIGMEIKLDILRDLVSSRSPLYLLVSTRIDGRVLSQVMFRRDVCNGTS